MSALLLLSFPLRAQQPPKPEPKPTIELTATTVTISGLTPKGKVVWLEAARVIEDMGLRLVEREDIARDDDGDGSVQLEPFGGVPPQAVFVAVDLTTGAIGTAAAPGFGLRLLPLPSSALHPGAVRNSDALDFEHSQLRVVIARAGVGAGAWTLLAGDGTEKDEDHAEDRRLHVGLDWLHPVGDTTETFGHVLKPHDVLVAVDIMTLELYAEQVGGNNG